MYTLCLYYCKCIMYTARPVFPAICEVLVEGLVLLIYFILIAYEVLPVSKPLGSTHCRCVSKCFFPSPSSLPYFIFYIV